MTAEKCGLCSGHGYLVIVRAKAKDGTTLLLPKNLLTDAGFVSAKHKVLADQFSADHQWKNQLKEPCNEPFAVVAVIGCYHCKGHGVEP